MSENNLINALDELKIAIIGLGYVGLPLAVEFGKIRSVIGFDINEERVKALKQGEDSTNEVEPEDLSLASGLSFTTNPECLSEANVYIVTVPTPIDEHKNPDLTPLVKANQTIAPTLRKGDIVIYESTVYPGSTEEDSIPILERISGLTFNKDFFAGYSPERINPGDKARRITNICKVTSGSTPDVADLIDSLYQQVVTAGTHKAPSIKVAEAAKVIENTQRDLNIALINELAIIFNKLDIDTQAVLEAAETKWNFMPFRPGLVGGHCIGVDPYYLMHKSESVGYHPEIITAGRRLNDNMSTFVVSKLIRAMLKKNINIHNAKVLIMGFTFKENCPDIRNTGIISVVDELKSFDMIPDIYDPWVKQEEVQSHYQLTPIDN